MKSFSFNGSLLSRAGLLLVIVLLLQFLKPTEEAIQCSDVVRDLAPCVSYLRSGSGSPSNACCSGVSSLVSAATTTADKRTACGCIKSAAQQIKASSAAAQALARICSVTLPFAVSPNVDCSQIS